jgi:hypothetical protein
VLEEKWILSEMAGGDVGLEAAKEAYIALGAPSPESVDEPADSSIVLDIDWSTGLDHTADVPDDSPMEADPSVRPTGPSATIEP